MSDQCHICGPVKHEAPTVICAPCMLIARHQEMADLDGDSRSRLLFPLNAMIGSLVDVRPRRRYR